jgi:hypothetical protein
MTGYLSFRFYSPEMDTAAVRLSMADSRGREYYAILPGGSGKGWRERRDTALDAIEAAIEAGEEPGEVQNAR